MGLSKFVLAIRYVALCFEIRASQKPNFALFDPAVKIKTSESICRAIIYAHAACVKLQSWTGYRSVRGALCVFTALH